MAALNDEGEIYLVRQYRYALDRELIEIPAGKLEKGEDPLEAAKRELGEEVGLCRRRIPTSGISFPPADIAARSFTCMRPRAFLLPWGCGRILSVFIADEFLFPEAHAAAD